jgi:molybdopterin converting factor subunit 1
MKIQIRYFASIREIVGRHEEILTLAEGVSVADVRALLLSRHPRLQPIMERSVYAVNSAYVPAETTLYDGDVVVFIPPVGGG